LEDSKELSKRRGIPGNQQQLSNAAPGELSEGTVEEDVRSIFLNVAQDTISFRLAMSSLNLGVRRKSVSGELPY
jgi:hypothetical protein